MRKAAEVKMSKLTLDAAKGYLRVTGEDEDSLIEALIAASRAYLDNAGAKNDGKLYLLAQQMLISHWFENREPTGNAERLQHGLAGIILQLQLGEEVEADEPGATE